MTTITKRAVIETWKEIVAEKGEMYSYSDDHALDTCSYSDHDGTASCLAGQIIFRLDPDAFDRIHRYEWHGLDKDDTPKQMDVYELRGQEYIYVDDDAEDLLADWQNRQDRGEIWSLLPEEV